MAGTTDLETLVTRLINATEIKNWTSARAIMRNICSAKCSETIEIELQKYIGTQLQSNPSKPAACVSKLKQFIDRLKFAAPPIEQCDVLKTQTTQTTTEPEAIEQIETIEQVEQIETIEQVEQVETIEQVETAEHEAAESTEYAKSEKLTEHIESSEHEAAESTEHVIMESTDHIESPPLPPSDHFMFDDDFEDFMDINTFNEVLWQVNNKMASSEALQSIVECDRLPDVVKVRTGFDLEDDVAKMPSQIHHHEDLISDSEWPYNQQDFEFTSEDFSALLDDTEFGSTIEYDKPTQPHVEQLMSPPIESPQTHQAQANQAQIDRPQVLHVSKTQISQTQISQTQVPAPKRHQYKIIGAGLSVALVEQLKQQQIELKQTEDSRIRKSMDATGSSESIEQPKKRRRKTKKQSAQQLTLRSFIKSTANTTTETAETAAIVEYAETTEIAERTECVERAECARTEDKYEYVDPTPNMNDITQTDLYKRLFGHQYPSDDDDYF